MIALISLKIMGSNCGNLRKKNKIQLLIWKREGRGEAQYRGKENHASPTFPGGSLSRSWWRTWVSPGAPGWTSVGAALAAIPHLPINLWKMHPASHSPNPFLAAPLPGTLFKFLPTVCPPSRPDPSQVGGREWSVSSRCSVRSLCHLWGRGPRSWWEEMGGRPKFASLGEEGEG